MQTIQLHLYEKPQLPVICAVQGDVGRKFQAVITDGSLGYTIPMDATFTLWYSGTSGEGNYGFVGDRPAVQVSKDTVTVELLTQMLACPGGGELCLCMSRPDGSWLGLWTIPYQVDALPGADSPEAVQSYTAFSDAVTRLQQAAQKIEPDESLSVAGKPADAAAVGAALAEMAPQGYGLGSASVTEKTSANDCLYNGWYKVQDDGILGDGDSCYIHTVAFGMDGGVVNVMQEGYRIGWNNLSQRMDYTKACRFYDGQEGWSPWEYENPPMLAGAEYRTTQRWNGKVVYTKLIHCGTMPNNANINVQGLTPNMQVIDFEVMLCTSYLSIKLPHFDASGKMTARAICNTNSSVIQILATVDMSEYTGYATIKYIKK